MKNLLVQLAILNALHKQPPLSIVELITRIHDKRRFVIERYPVVTQEIRHKDVIDEVINLLKVKKITLTPQFRIARNFYNWRKVQHERINH